MMTANDTPALFTDFYSLTMIQGYWKYANNPRVVFDMFFRRQPFQGGFSVFAGLDGVLRALEGLHFEPLDLEYLASLGLFHSDFLSYLEHFHFRGDLYAVEEGTLIFPHEPLIRMHSTLIEAQLIEGLLLNTINFQTLIATKTARVFLASNSGKVLEIGLRRAQGPDGALSASRASYIGGAEATSNTLAGKMFGIPVRGTMAHSWVMSFDDEAEAFRRFADLYPDNTTLLIDTYNTLDKGIVQAITIGKELSRKGKRFGVRLDSGDIQYLSTQVRAQLDANGLHDATIVASNELNEEIIHQLVADGAPVDIWGVGTSMVTGGDEASFSGVYKLVAKEQKGQFQPTMKVSDNPEKSTTPGIKQIWRFYDERNSPLADLITFADEPISAGSLYTFHHPIADYRHYQLRATAGVKQLLQCRMQGGRIAGHLPELSEIRERTIANLGRLDPTYRRIINPHIYKVSISDRVKRLKEEILQRYFG